MYSFSLIRIYSFNLMRIQAIGSESQRPGKESLQYNMADEVGRDLPSFLTSVLDKTEYI